jgi:hypothetical protein
MDSSRIQGAQLLTTVVAVTTLEPEGLLSLHRGLGGGLHLGDRDLGCCSEMV